MKRPSTSIKSETDWKRVRAMRDRDIDLSDSPEITPELFARAVVRRGLKPKEPKVQLTIRMDKEVLEWFRARGRGYQTHISSLLRAYMEAHKTETSEAANAKRARTAGGGERPGTRRVQG
jgi:uncharacterized protein (DUF4415 family)